MTEVVGCAAELESLFTREAVGLGERICGGGCGDYAVAIENQAERVAPQVLHLQGAVQLDVQHAGKWGLANAALPRQPQ